MSYNDLRKGRYSETNRIYFVTTVTYKRKPLFNSLYSARIVIQTMKQLDNDEIVDSLSWVVMPDHLHWLIQLSDEYTLPDVIKRLKAVSAQRLNKQLNRKGPIWQPYYHDHSISKEENLKKIARYIVTNPIRAGLTKNINNYSHWDAIWL